VNHPPLNPVAAAGTVAGIGQELRHLDAGLRTFEAWFTLSPFAKVRMPSPLTR
jgi:hypothetical protein